MRATGHESGDVRHVEDVFGTDFIGNLPHAGEIPQARICAGSADDDLWLFALGN